jgi:hypothetical protein
MRCKKQQRDVYIPGITKMNKPANFKKKPTREVEMKEKKVIVVKSKGRMMMIKDMLTL